MLPPNSLQLSLNSGPFLPLRCWIQYRDFHGFHCAWSLKALGPIIQGGPPKNENQNLLDRADLLGMGLWIRGWQYAYKVLSYMWSCWRLLKMSIWSYITGLNAKHAMKLCETPWTWLQWKLGGVSDVVEKVENDEGWWREWRGGWLLWKWWSCMGCFIFTWESLMKYGCVDEIASRIKTTWENPVCKVSPHDCGLAGSIMMPNGDLIHLYNFI